MVKIKVIFLCTGNSARSQIAEALLKKYDSEHFDVYSAGFDPKPINPFAVQVMQEMGVDIGSQYSKELKQFLGKTHFGIIITLCARAEQNCPTFLGVSTRLYWPFEDPAQFQGIDQEKIAKFREIRDQIDLKIKEFLQQQSIQTNKDIKLAKK